MVVTRKRSARKGRPNGLTKLNQMSQQRTKGIPDFSQEHYYKVVGVGKDLVRPHPIDSADPIAETTRLGAATRPVAAQIPHKDLEMETECMVENGLEISGSDMLQEMRQGDGNKIKISAKIKSKGGNGLGVKNSKMLKGSRLQKRPLFSFGHKSDSSQNSDTQGGENQAENGGVFERADLMAMNRMGYMVQGQSSGDTGRGNSLNPSDANRNSGMVRGRAGVSMEAPLSLNSNKHPNWRASFGSQSMESPMVEISHGHSGDFLGGGRGAEQATMAIGRAPLG